MAYIATEREGRVKLINDHMLAGSGIDVASTPRQSNVETIKGMGCNRVR